MQLTEALLRATPGYDLWHFRLPSGLEGLGLPARLAALVLWLPVILPLVVALVPRRRGDAAAGERPASLVGRLVGGAVPWAVDAVLATLAFVVVLSVAFDGPVHRRFQVEKCARVGDWKGVLAAASALRRADYTFMVNWDVNRALYHLGELPDRMFEFLQHPLGLFPSVRDVAGMSLSDSCWMKLADVMMDLGCVNEAEHMTYESMENLGDQPQMLRRLVMVYAAKDRPETARILLRVLGRDPVQGGWARAFLRRVLRDPSFTWHEPTQKVRPLMVAEDRAGWLEPADMLRDLLARNPRNRMAFEYLMADHLLRRELTALVGELPRLRDMGFKELPRCCEEAVVLCQVRTGRPVDTAGWTISPETLARYDQFCRIIRMYGGDREATRAALAPQFGRTYFYYYTFGRSGDRQ
jgi:hypothetical protein